MPGDTVSVARTAATGNPHACRASVAQLRRDSVEPLQPFLRRATSAGRVVTNYRTAYDAKFFNVKMPAGTKMQVTDRAYTSPIWYTPDE